eukprot:jgi/Tetstr1/462449/TSEL_007447.t1
MAVRSSPTTFGGARSRRALSAGRTRPRTRPTAVAAAAAARPGGDDLLVVGPGVLGSYAGMLWAAARGGGGVVTGQTNSDAAHGRLAAMGLAPTVKPADGEAPPRRYDNVLFSAPPSGSVDYPAEVAAALGAWTGAGAFVFTSSASVVALNDGGPADEASPTVPLGKSDKTDRLLRAEGAVRDAGGCVLRLVGLYHGARGAHTYFAKQGEVPRWGGTMLNLIHYEDAAGLAVAALAGRGRGELYVGCDGVPVSYEEMMDAWEAATGHGCTFTGAPPEGGAASGKRMSNAASRAALGWAPKYPSFAEFCAAGASDYYTTSGLF